MQEPALRLRKPRLLMVPLRVVLATFLVTIIAFAATLFFTLVTMVVSAHLRGVNPDLTFAYRNVAAPVAIVAGAIVLVLALVMEIRHYRRARALAGDARRN